MQLLSKRLPPPPRLYQHYCLSCLCLFSRRQIFCSQTHMVRKKQAPDTDARNLTLIHCAGFCRVCHGPYKTRRSMDDTARQYTSDKLCYTLENKSTNTSLASTIATQSILGRRRRLPTSCNECLMWSVTHGSSIAV